MKSNQKAKSIILIILGLFFTFSPVFIINQRFTAKDRHITSNYDNENLKTSKISGKIHINNNWTDAKDAGICTGNGTYSEPYIIEDLEINGQGTGSCILIENSNEYFRIENCTLYEAEGGDVAGIYLWNVNNSQLIGNNCSANYLGIHLSWGGYNNTVTGNILNNNDAGIFLSGNYYNTISGNTLNNNNWGGIYLLCSSDNTILGNTANDNYLGIQLYSSHNNTILGNTANYNNINGIVLFDSCYNTISGNTVNYNLYGVYLENSNNNIVSGNSLIGNTLCIVEENCQGNEFSDNGDCTYGQDEDGQDDGGGGIIPYDLFFYLCIPSALLIIIILLTKNIKKSNQK